VAEPSRRPSFEPISDAFSVRLPSTPTTNGPSRAATLNRVCARCHQVLFSQYPWTWEGGARAQAKGGANINSGEGRDLLLGACASRLSCVACHDPHAADNAERMKRLEGPAGDAVCQRCHPSLVGEAAVRAHTHHAPGGAGARCMACHMAKKNMSLDLRLTRYHRIGSPTDRERVEGDRPLECAMCHGDKKVNELADTMEKWWGKRYDRAALVNLYGNLDSMPLEWTVAHGKPHEQAAAAMALAEQGRKGSAGLLGRQLTNDIPLVRCYVLAALERMFGESGIDLHQERAAIEAAARKWLSGKGVEWMAGEGGRKERVEGGSEED
jgi:predicted CXXCH cytochrome family protein